ncbi:MAG: hypothetical protein WBA97_34395 [Actinophytocola sp.]|uniref:hypothetical protein n=1 Tax=Actinophytocola sp. TaxID=1872138 RepID=UPI003C70B620
MTDTRRDILFALARADRKWAQQHMTHTLPADRLDALARDLHATVTVAMQDQQARSANERGCLARLLTAVNGVWDKAGDPGEQTAEALKQLRRVEQYLMSLNHGQEVA